MTQYATKDFSPLNFEVWTLNFMIWTINIEHWTLKFELYDLNYELRELHESLSLIRGIRVIRSFLLGVYKFTSSQVHKLFVVIMIRGIRVIRSLFYFTSL